jgi:putative ABC transport system substrate-binding protein
MNQIVLMLKQWRMFFEYRKILLLLLLSVSSWASATDAAVIYPQLPEPYRAIFDTIIQGIEEEIGKSVVKLPLDKDGDLTAVSAVLKNKRVDSSDKVAIFLGKQSLRAEELMDDGGVPFILGAVLEVEEHQWEQHPILSLTPDPVLLFLRLKVLMPSARRVVVVYSPKNAWLIKLAQAAAKQYKLKLDAYEAHDLQTAVGFYRTFFSQANSQQDALWLLQDAMTVEESAILPLVLRESWNGNLVIFSSNYSHVKRGVLFSLYPDSFAMGKSLGRLAKTLLRSPGKVKNGMRSLRDVKGAINFRTLRRTGLDMSEKSLFETQYVN